MPRPPLAASGDPEMPVSTWSPIFDQAGSLSIGDLAIAPSNPNVIYVSTGEVNGGGGSLTYDGDGVWKSEDGGDSWTHLGLENVGVTGKVAIHPQTPNRVFVAAMGDLFGNTPDQRSVCQQQWWHSPGKIFFMSMIPRVQWM